MASSQAISGISSGLDTASIVEALMNVQKQSYNRTSEKVETEKLKLQAYQSVNSLLSSLKTSVTSLNSSDLWNGKTTTSSNEDSLKATATQYAVEGSYSLRVAQLATTAQYMTKGYSSATSTIIASGSEQTSGTITLESSKARVDTSASVDSLNGGSGIFRGSIRVTDASGATCVVDLSACETVDEILNEINNAAGVQVSATISDDGNSFQILDQSGGTGTMKIQNVGQGTTATDLGIASSSTLNSDDVACITGSNIFHMGSDTSLSTLRDGLGIEQGTICIQIDGSGGDTVDVYIDLTNAETVGDVLNAANSALKSAANGDEAIANLIGNLKLALNDDGNGFTFTGGQAGNVYSVMNVQNYNSDGQVELSQPLTAIELGLFGTFSVESDGDSFGGTRLLGDISSPMLASLSGANKTGIGSESSLPTVSSDTLTGSTKLTDLNGGSGVDTAGSSDDGYGVVQINVGVNGSGTSTTFTDAQIINSSQLRAITSNADATLDDLLGFLSSSFQDSGIAGLENIEFVIDSDAKGVYMTGLSDAYDYQFAGSLLQSLGLAYTGEGNAEAGYGSAITGQTYAEVEDLYSYNCINYKETTDDDGNVEYVASTVLGTAELSELTYGESGGYAAAGDDMDALLAGGMTITVGGNEIVLSFDDMDKNSSVNDLILSINTQLAEAGADFYLDTSYNVTGLTWANVSLDDTFKVEGDLAEFFGLDKDFDGLASNTVSTSVQQSLNPVTVGTAESIDLDGQQTLASLNGGAGLTLQGDKLSVDFALDDQGNSVTVSVTRDEILAAIESTGNNMGSVTLDEYVGILNDLFSTKIADRVADGTTELDGASIEFGLSGNGITVTNATGPGGADGLEVTVGGGLATASASGIAEYSVLTGADFEEPEASDIRASQVTEAVVTGVGYIVMDIGGTEVTLNTDGIEADSTLADLIRKLNKELSDKGYDDMSFCVSDSGTGIAFDNDSKNEVTFKYDEVSTLASDLGLCGTTSEKTDTSVSASSHANGSSLNRCYVDRATSLSSLNNGEGIDLGVIQVTSAQGTSVPIDISEATTIGEVIDAINGLVYGVIARINDAGDGIVLEQDPSVTTEATGHISVTSYDGSDAAKQLGIEGTSVEGEDGLQRLDGSMKTVIEVSSSDTLTDIMTRISALDAGYKTSIINDGTGTNSYRLSISSSSTGAASDFIIDTDIDSLTMQQVAKGQDSVVLYGDPNSGSSPVMLKSSTNSNNQAIAGLTLDLNAVSESYTTITVSLNTEAVVEEISNFVQAYNDLSDLIAYLDYNDSSTDTTNKGICYGDTTLRTLMDSIDDMFDEIFTTTANSDGKTNWSWADLGISFVTNDTNEDSSTTSRYSRIELDLDTLNDMVTNNWDILSSMMYSQENVASSKTSNATAGFNYQKEYDEDGNLIGTYSDPNLAINGDKSASNFGTTNGICGNKTIDEGENQYTVYFEGSVDLDRISIYYPSSDDSLKDFIVEYLDPSTGNWETYREVTDNASSSTIMGTGSGGLTCSGIRITASSTNASDGLFKLVEVQCLASTGLAGSLSKTMNDLTDVVDGYFTNANSDVEEKIADLQEQMEKMNERLEKKEESLWNKFNAMEVALSQLQSQSSTLSSFFSTSSSS